MDIKGVYVYRKYCLPFTICIMIPTFLACSNNDSTDQDNTPAYDPPEFKDEKAISGFGTNAMIAGTSGKPSREAALEILNEGGNACDAVLAGAMDQVVRAAGRSESMLISSSMHVTRRSARADLLYHQQL